MAWFAAWLTRLVRDGGSDTTPTTDDAVGREATVLTAIPAEGYGTVRVAMGGTWCGSTHGPSTSSRPAPPST